MENDIVLDGRVDAASNFLKAMASPSRLMILCALLEGEKTVGQLTEEAGLSQSAVSQHLGKLRAEQLVSTRRDAQNIHYRLADETAKRIIETLHERFCRP